jgi:excisionase family DNA binding protein
MSTQDVVPAPRAETDRLITTKDVADICAVSERTVRDWAQRGLLPAARLPGGARRFRRADAMVMLTPERPRSG